jgi:hypothetical protein
LFPNCKIYSIGLQATVQNIPGLQGFQAKRVDTVEVFGKVLLAAG